jgi:metallo-beta-lactamase family protein
MVTGSKFLIDSPDGRILVDAGLFQGECEWRHRNWDGLPVAPSSTEAVVITHAHLDHCGSSPGTRQDRLRHTSHMAREDVDHARVGSEWPRRRTGTRGVRRAGDTCCR